MNREIGGDLQVTPRDKRDFKLGKVFGMVDISEIPDRDFVVAEPLEIKDQGNSDLCAAFSACSVSEDQEGISLDPCYFFAKIKQIAGEYFSWGADLRTTCKAAVKYGFIEILQSLYNLENKSRNFIANWRNWPLGLDQFAQEHAKQSFFAIEWQKDRFDSFRSALWQFRNKRCSILTGVKWQREWTAAEGGIIPKEMGTQTGGHALKIFGQKIIDGEIYIVAQLSNGIEIGDKGIFYFPRKVINRDFTFGGYMFLDMDPEEAKKKAWSIWRRIWEKFKKIIKQLLQ